MLSAQWVVLVQGPDIGLLFQSIMRHTARGGHRTKEKLARFISRSLAGKKNSCYAFWGTLANTPLAI